MKSAIKFKCHQKTLIRILTNHIGSPVRGAEIGVWFGRTSSRLLKHFDDLHLYMIDSYKDVNRFRRNLEYTMTRALVEAFEGTNEWAHRRHLIVQESAIASVLFKEKSLDFVFIDAAHDYESVKEDIELWAPKVRDKGLVIGHDYGSRLDEKGKFGVKRAVHEYAINQGYEVQTDLGFLWYFIK